MGCKTGSGCFRFIAFRGHEGTDGAALDCQPVADAAANLDGCFFDGSLHRLVDLTRLCIARSAPEHEAHEDEKEQGLVGEATGGVEDDVCKGAGAVGQKGLVDFVGAGDEQRCAESHCVGEEASSERITCADGGVLQRHPETAEADDREQAVAVEVAYFAQDVVGEGPARPRGCTGDPFPCVTEGAVGVVGAKTGGGFNGEDAGEEQRGHPCMKEDGPARLRRLVSAGEEERSRGHWYEVLLGSWSGGLRR